jgi:Uri superfamily endonuclease
MSDSNSCSIGAAADNLTSQPGTYALLLRLRGKVTLRVGKLGACDFLPGLYVYVGSAMGPGGIRARVSRHLRIDKQKHWHVDVLRPECQVEGVCWTAGGCRLECAWVRALLALPEACVPARGFGAGDCTAGCPAHLVRLERSRRISQIRGVIAAPASTAPPDCSASLAFRKTNSTLKPCSSR